MFSYQHYKQDDLICLDGNWAPTNKKRKTYAKKILI